MSRPNAPTPRTRPRGSDLITLKRLLGAAIMLIVATIGLILVGLEPLFALSGGILAAAIVCAFALRGVATDVGDGPLPDRDAGIRGSEVSRLAWGFNPRTDVAGEVVARRVRAVLRRRLVRRGIDVDDPEHEPLVDEALGTGGWARLNARQATRSEIEHLLDVTDARARDDQGGGSAPPARRRRNTATSTTRPEDTP